MAAGLRVMAVSGAELPSRRLRGSWLPSLGRLAASLEAEHDRWQLWLPVLLGAGIALYFLLPIEPHPALAGAGLAAAAATVLLAPRGSLARGACVGLLAVAAGFATATLRSSLVGAPVLEREYPAALVSGFIELIEPQGVKGQRLLVRLRSISGVAGRDLPHRIRVRAPVYDRGLRVGDAVEFRARLGPPPPPALPGDYDFARRAWFLGIGGVGFIAGKITPLAEAPPPPADIRARSLVERARAALNAKIAEALPGSRGQIATALITGDQGGIAPQDLKALRDSGLAHILSVSGLHMAIMAGVLFWGLRLALATIPAVALRFPVKKWAAAGGIAGAYGYFLISGAAVATERSFIMITLMLTSVILDRRALSLRNVALAGLVILIYKPESLLDVSFQMSFSATIALIAAYEAFASWRERRASEEGKGGIVRGVLAFLAADATTTFVAGFASAPFAIATFHTNAQYGLIANMLALPVMTFLVMPCVLLTMLLAPLGLEGAALAAMGPGIDLVLAIGNWTASLPGAVWKVAAINDWTLPLFTVGGLWLVIWQGKKRWLGAIAIAAALALAPFKARPDILISRDGRTVAVRAADGRLAALEARKPTFDLIRWLEFEADRRPANEVATGAGFRCDGYGCVTKAGSRAIAIANHPAALAEDCRRADIVVARFNAGEACVRTRLLIDERALKLKGAHLIYLNSGRIEVETLADARGVRPWSDANARSRKLASRGPSQDVQVPNSPEETSAPERPTVTRPTPPDGWSDDDLP